jgi:hypothetical protein
MNVQAGLERASGEVTGKAAYCDDGRIVTSLASHM